MTDKKQGKPYTLEERNGRTVRLYESGAVLDHATGRIAAPVPDTLITAESTARMHRERREKKYAAVVDAANMVAQADAKRSKQPAIRKLATDPDAWLKAVAMGRTKAAMDPDSPYGNGAASWLTENTGNTEAKQAEVEHTVRHVHEVDDKTLEMLRAVRDRQVVDATLLDDDASAAPATPQPGTGTG